MVDSPYHKLPMEGEPRFLLLGRDPMFAHLLRLWAKRRENDIKCGDRPERDLRMVISARSLASKAEEWRRKNLGSWHISRIEAKEEEPDNISFRKDRS